MVLLLHNRKIRRIDPSRTGLLRRAFLADINKRLYKIIEAIKKLIIDEDAFGLENPSKLVLHATPGQFAFTTDANKLRAFHQWLNDQINAGILIVSGKGVLGKPWTYQYIEAAYVKGMGRAYSDSSKQALAQTPLWYTASREQFLRTAFSQPMTMGEIELLNTRAFEQLRGITTTMSQQLGRILATGLISGTGTLQIAREMQKSIVGLSKTRARMIARTEIIHAHAEGQLNSFKLLGIEELGILAEWSTAGDELVCVKCGEMEGKLFKIEEARGLLPLHPNCRCCWVPSDFEE